MDTERSAPPVDGDAAGFGAVKDPIPAENFDGVALLHANRRQPRSARAFGALALRALRLSREASPNLARLNAALQAVGVALLALQVILGKLALEGILEESGSDGSISAVIAPLLGLVGASGLAGLASAAQAQFQRLLGEHVQRRMVASILEVTSTVSLETFESPEFHDELQRVRVNAVMQPLNLSQALISLVGGGAGVLVLAIAIFAIEPLLVPVLLLSAIPQALVSRRAGRQEFDFRVDETPAQRVREYLQNVLCERAEAKEVRAFDLGGVLINRWGQGSAAYLANLRRHVMRQLRLALVGATLAFVATAASLGLLVSFVIDGRVPLASAGAAFIAIRLLASRISLVQRGVSGLFESTLFLEDYDRFIERRSPKREEPSAPRSADVEPFEELRVESVRFAYPQTEEEVLRGVSITIRAGEVVALVGENGSGKTTLAKLLCHIFAPTGGRITWDGIDVQTLAPQAVRRHVGVIFQDYVRYQLSARENIGFGRSEAIDDLDAIVDAARRGGSHEYLSRLPAGYETPLGKSFSGGYDLSLGQWQRLAISRAFFREANFLVFDEPTASLDARAEHRLFEQMRELAQGRALLLISHRFSSVRNVDRIYVLHEGEVAEHGSHDELMQLRGRYAELFELQASRYLPDSPAPAPAAAGAASPETDR